MAYNQGQFGQAPGYPGVPTPGPYTPQGQQPHFGVPAAAPPSYGAYNPAPNNHHATQSQPNPYPQPPYTQQQGSYMGAPQPQQSTVQYPQADTVYARTPQPSNSSFGPPVNASQSRPPPSQHAGQYGYPPQQQQPGQYGYPPQQQQPGQYGYPPQQQQPGQYGYPPQQQQPGHYGYPPQSGGYGNAAHPPPHHPSAGAGRVGGSAGMLQEKKQAAISAFQMYDRDRSGFVDAREFYSVITRLVPMTWEDACAVFAVIDDDRNGRVSLNEFIAHYVANY